MCDLFKFDAPSQSASQQQATKTQEEIIQQQQTAADAARADEKRKRTADLVARSAGLYGLRSLISGPAGGSGFLSKKAS
jgi:hypothetical protein